MVIDIFKEIKKVDLPEGGFVVVGSAILQIKNIREANDLDVLVSKSIYEQFKKIPGWALIEKIRETGEKWGFVERNNIQIHYRFYGAQEYDLDYFLSNPARTEIINGIYFTSLSELIRSKREWGRPKDVTDTELIKQYLIRTK